MNQQINMSGLFPLPWDYIEKQWWGMPVEFILVIYCFIGFHAVSSLRLLPSLDAFCRKWNISHHAAQPTIYALAAVAPIIILSNVACVLDVFHQTKNAHKLGVCSIIGFGLATASLIPSFSVFSFVGDILLPKTTTVRDHMFSIILLSMFLAIILSGKVVWWKSTLIGTIYIIYLFSIILYPKLKEICKPPNPLETNRLLNKLQEERTSTLNNFNLFQQQIEENKRLSSYQQIESDQDDEESPRLSPFDSAVLFKSSKNMKSKRVLITEGNYSNYSVSPDRKSMRSNGTSIASITRHPMLLNDYEDDLTGLPSDIEEYENESLTNIHDEECDEDEEEEDTDESINKIILLTPKCQQSVYHIYPTIKFESLNQHNLQNNNGTLPSKSKPDKKTTDHRKCLKDLFKIFNKIYDIISFPIAILIRCTIPSSNCHSKCECLYPVCFILSIIWITGFSFILIVISYHWSQLFSFKLSVIGIIYIGPLATLPNIIDGMTLSLQGYASEIIVNSYHIQISNVLFGIILPLLISSLLNFIKDKFHYYVEQGIFVYLTILILQSILLFVPLMCNNCNSTNNIQLTTRKAWIYLTFYIGGMLAFYFNSITFQANI